MIIKPRAIYSLTPRTTNKCIGCKLVHVGKSQDYYLCNNPNHLTSGVNPKIIRKWVDYFDEVYLSIEGSKAADRFVGEPVASEYKEAVQNAEELGLI